MFRTVLLVVGVVTATILVAVPFAWLVVRTDLPGRRAWATAAALPLVIPSYVAALCLLSLFGEKGLLQQALGVERLPDPTGYWGALAALTLSTYPYVFLLTQAALRDLDPGPGGGSTEPRRIAAARAVPGDAAVGATGHLARLAARRALHALRLRRRLAHAVRRAHARDLPAVPQPVRPHARGGARPRPRRPHGARARARSPRPLAWPQLPDESGRGAAREARAPRPLAAARTRLVRARRDGIPRAAGVRARLLAQAGDRQRPRRSRFPGAKRSRLSAPRASPPSSPSSPRCPSRSSRSATRHAGRACSSDSPSPETRSPAS